MPRGRTTILTAVLGALVVTMAAGWIAIDRRRAADRLMRADPEAILADARLRRAALPLGRRVFAAHCASCHGEGRGDPSRGIPDLTDGDWLYGSGRIAEIEQVVLHGIRSGDPRGWREASMPAYATLHPYGAEPIPPLTPAEIADAAAYLRSLHGAAVDRTAAARGGALYHGKAGCYDCHGQDAGGDTAIGAPNLADDVWLYGDGSAAAIERTLRGGRAGISPAFARTLTAVEARAVSVYVAAMSRHEEGTGRGG